jgi:hypothetical protein
MSFLRGICSLVCLSLEVAGKRALLVDLAPVVHKEYEDEKTLFADVNDDTVVADSKTVEPLKLTYERLGHLLRRRMWLHSL